MGDLDGSKDIIDRERLVDDRHAQAIEQLHIIGREALRAGGEQDDAVSLRQGGLRGDGAQQGRQRDRSQAHQLEPRQTLTNFVRYVIKIVSAVTGVTALRHEAGRTFRISGDSAYITSVQEV